MLDRLLDANQVAEETGMSTSTIRDLWVRGELPYILPHCRQRGKRIRESTLKRWMDERESESIASH
jgi:predicted DNA-binding transcriptional regulator AlpA